MEVEVMESQEEPPILQKFKKFCRINRQFNIYFEKTHKDSNFLLDSIHYIATELLHIPQYQESIASHFSELLPRLVSIAIFFDEKNHKFDHSRHTVNCVLLGNILKLRPDLCSYALKYFSLYPSPFDDIKKVKESKKMKKQDLKKVYSVADIEIVECCLALLLSDFEFYRTKWDWSKFISKYRESTDERVKWITGKCTCLITKMNEKQSQTIMLQIVSEEVHNKFTYIFNEKSTLNTYSSPQLDLNPTVCATGDDVMNANNIAGIYIPTKSYCIPIKENEKSIIEVESTTNNLRKIALGLTLNRAICLQGPVGCGKTTLVEYLAAKTGRVLGKDFIKIQLGDQMDSKMLLGTYRCTDVPGEFVWQAGVLTQAVIEGCWLLMEDIDSANMDIASVLTNLLENKSLSIPGFRDNVPITPGFQLFFTRRFLSTISGHHKKHSNSMTLMKKHLVQINIDPFVPFELKQIILEKHPEFLFITDRLVEVYKLFSYENPNGLQMSRSSRLISTRDFFKWCSRAIVGFNPKSQESTLKVLQDGIDIFCCAHPDLQESINLAKQICTLLGIVNQKAEYFYRDYKPNFNTTETSIIANRAVMEIKDHKYVQHLTYINTMRPSAVLLERIMCCVNSAEPVLLVGETGTGKTSTVQYLASEVGKKLVVINMNQQSDSADLLGGFKPVDLKYVITPLKKEFDEAFAKFFDIIENRDYLNQLEYLFNTEKWPELIAAMKMNYEVAIKHLNKPKTSIDNKRKQSLGHKEESKKNKDREEMKACWSSIGQRVEKLTVQLKQKTALAFAFIEGTLVKAIQNGYWVLLDEINLANAETLECLSGLLEGSEGSLCLLERGDKEPIKRHPDFTLFACMNPSTDVGKRDLPAGLRNRFTEFFVHELTEKNDLLLLVESYMKNLTFKDKALTKIVDFYLKVRKEAETNLLDGVGHKPHFSLRSLCRALMIASKNPCGMQIRSLYESFCLSFLTQLDAESYKVVQNMITCYLIEKDEKKVKAVLNQPIPRPESGSISYIQFEGYWVQQGNLECTIPEDYILTDYVRKNLKDLVRVVSIGKLPVLLQGDTSVGKTSLITYLARASGNKCVRINNHEHTDLQEYIGSYVADINGKLVFREGLLVEAMRQGHWIILDELNLAPTDVLEALNRVLDDNRELFIPETQQVVKAHQNFMLFATQNPPGAYGGRKMLSRAFRNRFVELHFTEIPPKELEFILHKRCQIALSYAKKMISVMTDLQVRRRGSAAFAGKQGFMTLRDLFRWGERYRLAENLDRLYDWDQHLADEGYLVLAGRVRKLEEKKEIIIVLQKHLKREVIPDNLFTLSSSTSNVTRKILEDINKHKENNKNIVWTFSMRQLAVLVAKALQFKEPVLLVGETGGGKTTVCKVIADNNGQELVTVNCHMHTESSDFIGGLRPVRNREDSDRLFEWVNGPLIQAMEKGSVFLADEISLADDSVLERLNSLLEPERCLLLAEKGTDINNPNTSEMIKAHNDFFFIGTMNPGGDFGKKELSPALRNRFTEIWCEPCTIRDDLISIVEANINEGVSFGNQEDGTSGIGKRIMDFIEWFRSNIDIGKKFTVSIRDILTWVNFINTCSKSVEIHEAYVHGASLTFLDSFGSGVTSGENLKALEKFKKTCLEVLNAQVQKLGFSEVKLCDNNLEICEVGDKFGIRPFFIDSENQTKDHREFFFEAPTTLLNCLRILRGMQLHKAILLEGSPGVGKTSLITALAESSGHKIYKINLSDQTDISDLFGADLPVEGGTGGQFSWKDGPLLQALKQGHWILLDELNLASQSVLEGLNACLDHRGEIFIPELGKTFLVKKGTRFFAAQNPLKQGGSRRGLPQSFLNRFIQVYIDTLTNKDLHFILTKKFPQIPIETRTKMVEFNVIVDENLSRHKFGNKGAPWECNLRDLTRWCEATIYHHKLNRTETDDNYHSEAVVNLLYADRMRTSEDKEKVHEIFEQVFDCKIGGTKPILYFNQERVYFGDVHLDKDPVSEMQLQGDDSDTFVLRSQLPLLRSLSYCVNLGWMSILVGSSGCGKSGVIKTLANLAGKTLKTFPVTSAMDTTDILGGFEQTDYSRHLDELHRGTEAILNKCLRRLLLSKKNKEAVETLKLWESLQRLHDQKITTIGEEIQLFLDKLDKLRAVWNRVDELKLDIPVGGLREKGEVLWKNVLDDRTLNAGGKFEWVDSVLIKCLQNGHWLLVDNVNLCSSAVLDRLNALLEPRGVLTIGERGVDKEGRMMEIEPHADFRLFLTMDPKNGEISRAMRNRGVEIYILSDRALSNYDLDLRSMIQVNGLESRQHITVLNNMHTFICALSLGDQPTVNELLQSASLISQQLKYGVGELQAFHSTLIEVYCKTKSPVEFCTDDVSIALRDLLKEQLVLYIEGNRNHDWYNENFTVKTENHKTSSELKKFKHQSALIHSVLSNNLTLRHDNIMEYLLALFYSMSTPKDLATRHDYLKYTLGNDYQNLSRITELMLGILKDSSFNVTDLPVDRRWLPETIYHEKNGSDVNATMLKLLLTVHQISNDREIEMKPRVAMIDYMHARRRNEIADKFKDVIVTEFLSILEAFDSNLLASLQKKDLKLSNEEVIIIMFLNKWRFAFANCALVDVTNKREHSKILTNLKVHYNWFLKYAVKDMFKTLNFTENQDLRAVLHRVNLVMDRQSSGLFKIGKNYQKHINKPPPYTERSNLETMTDFDFISEFYNICDRRNKFTTVLRRFEHDSNMRNMLIDLKVNFTYNFGSFSENMDVLKLVHSKIETEMVKELDRYKLELVPFVHYMEELNVRRKVSLGKVDEQMVGNSSVMPTDLVGTCLKYAKTGDQRLLHEFVKCYFIYLNDSPSVHLEEYLEDKEEDSHIALSGHHPKLSFYLAKLLIRNDTGEINNTKLGNFRELMNQHRTLNVTLWNNVKALHSSDYDFINIESNYLNKDLQSFIQQLSSSFNFDSTSLVMSQLIDKCVYQIEDFQNSVTSQEHCDAILKFAETLRSCYENLNNLMEPSTNKANDKIELISDIHTQLGYLKLTLNSQLHLIDPLTKKAIKKELLKRAIWDFKGLKTCFELQNEVFSASFDTIHELHKPIKEMIEKLTLKTNALGEYVAIRSEKIQYESVFMIIKNSMSSILSKESFERIEGLSSMIMDLTTAINDNKEMCTTEIEKILSRHEPSLKSYENTILEWSKYRISYPDIVEPLLSNVAQFLYGYKMKVSYLRKVFEQYKFFRQNINIEKTIVSLIKYPVLDQNQTDYMEHIDAYFNQNVQNLIDGANDSHTADQENLRLLKCGIQEAFNTCVAYSSSDLLDTIFYQKFIKLIEVFVAKYNEQEQKKEEAKKEAESLYKMRTKCTELSEDEEIEKEIRELFTNYHSIDFADMQPQVQLTDDPESEMFGIENKTAEISYEDLKFVSELHTILVKNFTKSEWLMPENNNKIICNFIRPLMQKFKVFRLLLDKVVKSLDYNVDKELFGSFSVLLGVIQKYGKEDSLDDPEGSPSRHGKNDYSDFYKDADVDEVKSCYHILEELRRRIEELLDEWPEQPTLKSIIEVVNRIYNFDINSPVSRFLTGFEILLNKCHEWEQVAHSGVSLSQFEQNIIQQIITWRKKELTMWKNLLNSTFDKLNDSKAKWWLYLFRVSEQFIIEKLFTVEELISTLQKFITNSNIAEFQMRLDLLYTFHCFAVNFKDSEHASAAKIYQNVLWNLYQYYDQFRVCITMRIKELRSPVEKKLKDYVKIVKWKDISYWSVKDTVDKSHKILHKHVREYKSIMTQPVVKFLIHTNTNGNNDENIGIWDRPQRHSPKKYHYTMDAASYMARKTISKNMEATPDLLLAEESGILSKMNTYFNKSRTLCKDIIEATRYPNSVKTMDEFVADVIQTSSHLQKLEVDTTLPKNKQKSQAKNILQQKHRALAELFKTLSKIGLSFRTGIVDNSTKNNIAEFTIKPVDLKASFGHVGNNKNDDKILTIWESCEIYFLRSLIRFNTLEGAILQPAQDLGVSNIERCKGFTAHLLSLSHKQKTEMIEMSRNLYYLRHCFNNLSRFCNNKEFFETEYLENLSNILKKLIIISKQYKVILNTFPIEDTLNISQMEIIELENNAEFPKYKYDANWNKLHSSLNSIIELSTKNQTIIAGCTSKVPCLDFDLGQSKLIPAEDGQLISSNLEIILEKSRDILTLIGDTHLQNSLKWLLDQIVESKNNFKLHNSANTTVTSGVKELKTNVEKSSSKILLVIQEIFKKYSKLTKDKIDEKHNDFEEDLLKTVLIENLLDDIKQLNTKKVLKSVKKVTELFYSENLPLSEDCKLLINQYLSLLEQIMLLYQYFLTQQVSTYRVTCKLNSILLNIFIELAGKGFCVPPELSDEEQGPGQPSNGMGLGDGEGEKDVSDKIESEDQLDEANVEGQEKQKEEDPDCKEEENGIEMNEDFDSKLQDMEKKENEDDEDEDDKDSDAEEQMGDTEKGADKLDEEVWGSDKEDDDDANDEEEGNQEEETGNKGEDEQDQQIGAKDKDSKNQPTDEDKEEPGEDQEQNKKEINELEEPEVDEDQVDPYHGNLPEPPEPEPMELPDDLQLDEGEDKEEEQNEENPFDIDAMKEQNIPEDQEETPEENEEKQKDEVKEFDSEDEEIKEGEKDDESKDNDDVTEEDNQNNENEDNPEDKGEESKMEDPDEEKDEAEDEKMDEQSAADQTQSKEDQVEAMEVDEADAADKTQGAESENKSSQPIDEINQEDKPDQDGMGQSQMEESQTGHSTQTDKPQETDTSNKDRQELKRKERPGESDTQRSLGDVNEQVQKKLKTMDAQNNEEDNTSKEPEEDDAAKAEMYKHIKDAKEDATQVLDAATKEQAEAQKEQTVPNKEEEEAEDPTESSHDLPEEEDEDMDIAEGVQQKPEKFESQKDKKKDTKSHPDGEVLEELDNIEIEGEVIETATVARAPESSHHTLFADEVVKVDSSLSMEEVNSLRMEVEQQMSSWNEPPSDVDAEQTWQKISSLTSPLAQELSEQLRLVLEPTQASRLKGDYRTGRRINMRKVIPYIASQFRKDKIWLRRTKPSKREYQIVLAIDDSSSMADNKSKEMAFESVALISKALTLLESGQLSILSFGEQTEILHKLTDQFTERSGVKLLQQFKFDQKKTRLAKMVDFATEMLCQSQIHNTSLTAKLLIIISDGRGVFSEGETVMRQAVRRGKLANIFTVFVIIDNPDNKQSILDNRKAVFKSGNVEFKYYMDEFPFSFYILLRDLVSLPNVLSDALRQWFEMVSNLE